METKVGQFPVSHRAWAWFEKNRQQALIGISVLVIAGVVISFFLWRQGQRQVHAGQALSNIAMTQTSGAAAGGSNPQDYLKLASEYPNTKAAAQALLLAGGEFFAAGKYAEAQAQFERFSRDYHNSPLLGEALLGIGSCLEAQGKTDQAVTAYKELISRHPTASVIPQAKFSLGGLYERQKRPELARDMYEQVERESRYSILGSEAGMRLEELPAKNPNLPPSLGTATPTPTVTAPAPAMTAPAPAVTAPAPAVTAPAPTGSNAPVVPLPKK